MHPEGFFNTNWTMFKFVLLLFTCSIVPLRLAFPEQFDSNRSLWDVSEVRTRPARPDYAPGERTEPGRRTNSRTSAAAWGGQWWLKPPADCYICYIGHSDASAPADAP